MKRFGFILAFAILFMAPVLAQPTTPEPTSPTEWYSSIVGVITATGIGVAIVKRAFGGVPYLNTIPAWLYAVIISFGLVYMFSTVTRTLPGDFWQNAIQAVISAASATGFYEWLNNGTLTKSLAATAQSSGVIVLKKNLPTRDAKK